MLGCQRCWRRKRERRRMTGPNDFAVSPALPLRGAVKKVAVLLGGEPVESWTTWVVLPCRRICAGCCCRLIMEEARTMGRIRNEPKRLMQEEPPLFRSSAVTHFGPSHRHRDPDFLRSPSFTCSR